MSRQAASPTGTRPTQRRYRPYRLLVLTGALLLLIVNPLLNAYLGVTFIQGWYQSLGIGELRLTSPLEGLESLLITRQIFIPTLIGMIVPLLLAALLGRVFCSWICPISLLAEVVGWVRGAVRRKWQGRDRLTLPRQMLWYALIGEILFSLIIGMPIFVVFSPPGLVGRELMMAVFFQTLAWEGVLVIVVLLLELLSRRFFCRYLCPLGGLLALTGTRRRLVVARAESSCTRCGRCDRACPLGIKPSEDESLSPYCWNCAACIDSCEHQALLFSWRHSQKQTDRPLPPAEIHV